MECGGKRSATPLWLRAERAPEPEASVRPAPRLRRKPKRRRRFALPAHSIEKELSPRVISLNSAYRFGPIAVPGIPVNYRTAGTNFSDELVFADGAACGQPKVSPSSTKPAPKAARLTYKAVTGGSNRNLI